MAGSAVVTEIYEAMQLLALPEKQQFYPRFFKAGPGQYAHGDEFIGVTVPEQRKIAKAYFNKVTLIDIAYMLKSPIHEHRHLALLMLVAKYGQRGSDKQAIANFYMQNRAGINNWDLVDSSAYKILGHWCYTSGNDDMLRQLAAEDNLWSVRIAIVATMYHVKQGSYTLLQQLVLQHMGHKHDLIHKAAGWLLREMGNKDEAALIHFLQLHYKAMPRTMLRYAIEKLDSDTRQRFLRG